MVALRPAGFFGTAAFFVPARLLTIFLAGFAPAVFLAAPRAFLVALVVVTDLPMQTTLREHAAIA